MGVGGRLLRYAYGDWDWYAMGKHSIWQGSKALLWQALYDSGRNSAVSNPDVGMSFVRHPQAYTVFRNSNHAVASWLRELGSTTRGFSFGANWRVATAQD